MAQHCPWRPWRLLYRASLAITRNHMQTDCKAYPRLKENSGPKVFFYLYLQLIFLKKVVQVLFCENTPLWLFPLPQNKLIMGPMGVVQVHLYTSLQNAIFCYILCLHHVSSELTLTLSLSLLVQQWSSCLKSWGRGTWFMAEPLLKQKWKWKCEC